jgi:iron(III) transport system permease protein
MRRGLGSYPFAVLAALATIAPVVVLFVLSRQAEEFLGPQAGEILVNTLLLTALTVVATILLGVPLAFLTAYAELPWRRLWVIALALPLAMPSYIGAFTFTAAFGEGGELARWTGIALPRLDGLAGTVLVMTLYTFPFVLLTTRASLRGLDGNLVNAARTLGLSLPGCLWRVVLPRVRNGIAAGALLVALYTLSDFATPAIMRFDTFTRMIFVEYNAFGLGRAAMLSLQLLAIVGIVLVAESRFRTVREGDGRCLSLMPGPIWLLGAVFVVLAIFTVAIGLPLSVFGTWLAREGAGNFEWEFAWNSLSAALLAASGAVVVAIPVAYAATAGRFGKIMERITYLGYGVPGIVMGTALVYLGLRVGFLYQTLTLLVIAYVLRFLPLAVGSVRSTLERMDGNLIHAARTLGARRWEIFRRVSLPLTLRGIVAGGALVFLEVMRELPATLLLRPNDFETLATNVWDQTNEARFADAAPFAMAILVISGALVGVLLMRGESRLKD